MMETLYIESIPGLKEEIIKRSKGTNEDFIDEDEVKW
jgi:hypothetical protein